MAETELERAEKRVFQAQARLQSLKARASVKARKLDTRRKIILGGALLERAERGDNTAGQLVDEVVNSLIRKADKAAFADWSRKGK